MNNVLVTGGAGFVGSHTAEKLSKLFNVVVIDNLSTGFKYNVSDNITFINADVNNFNDILPIFTIYKFKYVFHYAAVVGVKRTLKYPLHVLDDIKGIENILCLCKNTGVERIFYSSSSEVYGEPVENPQNEITTPLNCRLPYACVKNIGEIYIKNYCKEYDFNYTIFRFFNTFGPRQSIDFVISKFILACLNNSDITIYGDGKQTRSFNFIENNVNACTECINIKETNNITINIGSDYEITINTLASIIKRMCNSSSNIIHLPALKEGDMLQRCPDISMMNEIIANNKKILFNDGLIKTIEYFKQERNINE